MRTVIFMIFMAITIGGWIVNLINSQNHPPPPPRRRRDPEGQEGQGGQTRVQSEIAQFLDEARRSRQGKAAGADPSGIEVVQPPQRPAPKQNLEREQVWREQTQGRRRPAPSGPEVKVAADRPKSKKDNRQNRGKSPAKPASPQRSSAPGAGAGSVSQHVQSQMAHRVGQAVARDLPHAVNSQVQSHLGEFKAEREDSLGQQGYQQTRIRQNNAVRELKALLTKGAGVRHAVLLNEMLSPPLYRRKRIRG